MATEPFLSRVKIRNYKNIGNCDVQLGRLTILVGRNGSGKSNFLDAIRFIVEGLQTSLDHAIKSRGGVDEVRRKSQGHPRNFGVEVDMNLPDKPPTTYGFEIGAQPKRGFYVKKEYLNIGQSGPYFRVEEGLVKIPKNEDMPPAVSDRLYLVTASSLVQFRGVYDALSAIGFYNLNPEQMKDVQSPDAGELLVRDGSNIASVVARLSEDRPQFKERIKEYLNQIVPDISDFFRVSVGHRETLQFIQEVKGSKHPWKFYSASMSDGTLRVLGVLVAAMQLADRKTPVKLVGIEEPETALHPAAAGALMDSLREAAEHTQILITTHSPDLLDNFHPETDDLLVVQSDQGTTEIGQADPASLDAIRNHLYTVGELLRMDQLQPDLSQTHSQGVLFAHDSSEDET